jgi:RNA polymerase sigma-70 factor (ECF subfamily)
MAMGDRVNGGPTPATAVSDESLIEAAGRGEHEAYGELVRRYSAIAHRAAVLIAGSADSEDAVQEAFVRAFYALPKFRRGEAFKPWLLAIVTNCARNRVRSQVRRTHLNHRLVRAQPAATSLALSAPSAETAALSADERSRLIAAVASLPERSRLVITCRYLLELSEAETVAVLGWPAGTVKSRLSRALDRLREELDESDRPLGTQR